MSIITLSIAIMSACVFLFYFCVSLRACITGGGFRTVGDLFAILLILGISSALTLWLGPIGLAGIGVL